MKLLNTCSVAYMRSLQDGCIDLVVTDPPYKVTSRGGYTSAGGMMLEKDMRSGNVFKNNNIKIYDWIEEVYRVLKDGSHCYLMCNNKNLHEFLDAAKNAGFHFVKSLIWVKNNKIMSQMYMSQFEYVLFLRKGKAKRVSDCGISDVLFFDNPKDKDHPTQKPVDLFKLLISQSSQTGDTVLDPFMGTGASAIASSLIGGLNFVGVEIDETYYQSAKQKAMVDIASE